MNRRKFIAATSVSVGVAGCLTGNGTDDGGDGTESDDTGDASLDANDSADEGHSSDPGTDEDAGNRTDGDESATDSESDDSGDSEAENNGTDETDGEGDDGGDTDEDDANDTDGDEDGSSERTTSFESCTRATVSGSFADGDVAFASTGFYDEDGLYGNTIVEDGVVFGDDVAAPFSGTVAFEIGARGGVSEGSDEIVVTVSDYGSVGTVITSLTTEQTDYAVGSPTTPNPHAEDCLSELEAEAGGDGSDGSDGESGTDDGGDTDTESGDGESDNGDSDGGDGGSDAGAEPSLQVSIVGTNSPVDAGDYLEGTVRVENTGDAAGNGTVDLVVGRDPTTVESRSVSLAAGEQTTFTMGYQTPPVASDQEVPVRVETADDSDRQTVRVRGVQ